MDPLARVEDVGVPVTRSYIRVAAQTLVLVAVVVAADLAVVVAVVDAVVEVVSNSMLESGAYTVNMAVRYRVWL